MLASIDETLMGTPLLYEKSEGVAYITLNRPERRNALTPELVCRLADAIQDYAADDSLRAAIITGAGDKAFCAGGDLGTMIPLLTGARLPGDEWDRRVLNDPVVMAASSLRDYPLYKPVIAAINGSCLAGGAELILGTDIRVAAEHATFGFPEAKRAVIPFAGSMVRLPRQIAFSKAMEMMLIGDPIGAQEAYRIGLVNHVVPAAEVLPKAEAIARRIAENGPLAVQRIKETVVRGSGLTLQEGYVIEDESRRIVLASEDAKEGPRAFIEKRPPRYSGR
jgi:enoyl-CoA hydratase